MSKILLILFYISFVLNKLTPNLDNAVIINEKEIKCNKGDITYKINNPKNKNYIVLITNYYSSSFSLYENDNELISDLNFDYDYFYKVNNYNILYFVGETYSEYCLSFIFLDTNSITLKENEEFFHPILSPGTKVEFKITNILNKLIFLSLNNIDSYHYYVYINNKIHSYSYSTSPNYIFMSYSTYLDIKLEIWGKNSVPSIRYQSIPYSNISDDTFICNENSNFIHTYIINENKNRKKNYIWVQSNTNIELYENNYYYSSVLSLKTYYYTVNDYYILIKNKGCFQILYLESKTIIINETTSYKILNSEDFEFEVEKPDKQQTINLAIYSDENNFIKEIKEGETELNFKINKKDNKYIYNYENKYSNFISSNNYYVFKIKFNLNAKNYIIVGLEVQYGTITDHHARNSIITVVLAFVGLFLCFLFCKWLPNFYENYKKERAKKKEIEEEKKAYDLYDLITKDYTLIEKVCFICCLNDKIPILNLNLKNNELIYNYNYDSDNNNDNNNQFDIIDDINRGRYDNFIKYITPEKCPHFYHQECCIKYNKKHPNIKDPNNCYFCRYYVTLKNIQIFGCFFDKYLFKDLIDQSMSSKAKEKTFQKIKEKFFSLIQNNWKLDSYKKNKLMKIKRINEKYIDNIKLYKYSEQKYNRFMDLTLYDNLDKKEQELNEEIEKLKEEQRRKKQKKYNYSDDEEEEDDVHYYNSNNYSNSKDEREGNRRENLKVCIDCRKRCGICGGNIDAIGRSEGHRISSSKPIAAHKKCIIDHGKCFMCKTSNYKGDAYNVCYRCFAKNGKSKRRLSNCFYCQKKF